MSTQPQPGMNMPGDDQAEDEQERHEAGQAAERRSGPAGWRARRTHGGWTRWTSLRGRPERPGPVRPRGRRTDNLARMAAPTSVVDTVVSLCKRRGFVFPCGEIYGGTRSAWDYGPLGVELKENIKRQWWRSMVTRSRGRRRARLLDHPAPPDVGRLRPRRRVHRPAHRVPELPQALPRRPHAGGGRRAGGEEGQGGRPRLDPARRHRLPQLRHPRPVDRAARVQHDAQDLPRRHRGRVGPALPPSRDRAGHLHQLPQRHAGLAQEAAVRHRPDRQVLPQRDHPGQLHLPHPRVRADGDGVLRQARARTRSGTSTGSTSAPAGTPTSASPPRTCATTSTRRRSCPTTPSAPSTSSTASTSRAASGASSRASPTAPTSTSRPTRRTRAPTSSTSTRRPARSTPPTSSSRRRASPAA